MHTYLKNVLLFFLSILILAIIISCSSTSGYLRGDTIMFMRFPKDRENAEFEEISLNNTKGAYRAFLPLSRTSNISIVTIPDALWGDIEKLRQNWCASPPTFEPSEKDDLYHVVFQCGIHNNPTYNILPEQLPTPLVELISLVPKPLNAIPQK